MEGLTSSFLAGVLAGYGIAIPVGAISVLIIETALRRGFAAGFVAGAGAATVDGFYALVAALAGAAVAGVLEPLAWDLRALSAIVLMAIGVRGLLVLQARRNGRTTVRELPPSLVRTYATFVALTVINPMTVVYFAALILGLPAIGSGPVEKLAFIVGALLASGSWQTVLAVVGSLFHQRLSDRLRVAVTVVGNLIILGFALNIARGLITG
jgi:arginine exporter protein ArgO